MKASFIRHFALYYCVQFKSQASLHLECLECLEVMAFRCGQNYTDSKNMLQT